MATYTTNLGLIKPAYTDDADISDINDNMDTIDTAFGNISQSTLRDVPLAVAVSDWTAVTGGFSAEFTTAYVTASSKEEVFYDSSLKDYCQAHIIANKKSGGGGIILTTAVKPTGTITGTVRIFDNGDGKVPILIEDTVTPIANGGTGQSSLAGAQQVLGITALNTQITNVSDGTSFTMTAYNANVTINEQYCRSYGKLKFVYVKFTTSTSITSWSHLISLGFNTACPWYGNIFNPSTGKFLTDTIVYSDANNTTLRNYTPLAAGTYAVSFVAVAS